MEERWSGIWMPILQKIDVEKDLLHYLPSTAQSACVIQDTAIHEVNFIHIMQFHSKHNTFRNRILHCFRIVELYLLVILKMIWFKLTLLLHWIVELLWSRGERNCVDTSSGKCNLWKDRGDGGIHVTFLSLFSIWVGGWDGEWKEFRHLLAESEYGGEERKLLSTRFFRCDFISPLNMCALVFFITGFT